MRRCAPRVPAAETHVPPLVQAFRNTAASDASQIAAHLVELPLSQPAAGQLADVAVTKPSTEPPAQERTHGRAPPYLEPKRLIENGILQQKNVAADTNVRMRGVTVHK